MSMARSSCQAPGSRSPGRRAPATGPAATGPSDARGGCGSRGGSKVAVITTERHRPVALVILDRPEARNALTAAMIGRLATVLAEADADPDVAVVVLTGRDPAFCAGLDLKDLARTYRDVAEAPGAAGTTGRPGSAVGSPPRPPNPGSERSTGRRLPAGSSSPSAATSSSPRNGPPSPTPTPGSGSCPPGA